MLSPNLCFLSGLDTITKAFGYIILVPFCAQLWLKGPWWLVHWAHGPACIAFHCSHLYITNPGSVSHFAKTWVSLQTTTYIRKSTKYIDILLLLTCEEVLHAPTVQISAQNSTILTPNNLLIVCHSSIMNWSQNILLEFKVNVLV